VIARERAVIAHEHEMLAREREAFASEYALIARESVMLTTEREATARVRRALPTEHDVRAHEPRYAHRVSGPLRHPTLDPDPVIDAYKPGVDVTLLRENLKLTPDQRIAPPRRAATGRRGASSRRPRGEAVTDFGGLLAALAGAGVEFIIIGGAAATVHGSARLTQDLEALAELERLLAERG
jgi:hypothetical protein